MHALVTGGVQGIGRAIVENFRERGDQVYVFDIAPRDNERVQVLTQAGVFYAQADVSSKEQVTQGFVQLFDFQKTQYGAKPTLDILVNNAGITRDGLILRMEEGAWDQVMDVNAKGAFLCAQQALPVMVRQQVSYIINISSVVGLLGHAGQANYAASKAALIGFTKSLAQEYAKRNVLVNAIAPGLIATAMTDNVGDSVKSEVLGRIPVGRFGEPKDIANIVGFLTSGQANYITGQVLGINGGLC